MELGIAMFVTDLTIRPDRLAREVEERGFGSLWVPEHTHMPVDHAPHPSGRGLPDEYRRQYDPLVALSAAAAVTSRIQLATGICLVAQHDPIVLAKAVASLDQVSEGRVVFGVGYGWNRPEVEDHGVAFADRRAVLRERVLAMRALWTQEEAAFVGEHVSFGPTWSWPKPVQDPHPPILLGASAGPAAFDQIVEFADGWLPIGASAVDRDLPDLHRRAEAAGRDPATLSVTVYGTKPTPEKLESLARQNVDRTVLWLSSSGEDQALRELDELTPLLDAV